MSSIQKPYPEFPLFVDGRGQWRKDVRVNGGKPKSFYFGTALDDPKGERALKEWLRRQDGIRAGLDHLSVAGNESGGRNVVKYLADFMAVKQADLLAGDLSDETYNDYRTVLNSFGQWIGPDVGVAALGPNVWAAYRRSLATKLGPNRLSNAIKYIKAAFHYGSGQAMFPPVVWGVGFNPPKTDPDSKAMVRQRKGEVVDEEELFTGVQAEWFIARASPTVKACILLSLNCGIGPSDLGRLKWANIQGRVLRMRRGKTAIRREAYLWKRTREALAAVKLETHSAAAFAKDGDKALCFFTPQGKPLVDRTRTVVDGKVRSRIVNSLSITFSRWVAQARVQGVLPANSRLTYYNFRHTYYSHAEDCGDTNAVYRSVGHALQGQGRTYKRKRFPARRLKVAALFAKRRIWPKAKEPKPTDKVQPGQLRLTA